MNPALRDLARAHGVLTGYTDGWGKRRHPDDETLLAVLRSLAVPIDHPDEAPGLLRSHLAERRRRAGAGDRRLGRERSARACRSGFPWRRRRST